MKQKFTIINVKSLDQGRTVKQLSVEELERRRRLDHSYYEQIKYKQRIEKLQRQLKVKKMRIDSLRRQLKRKVGSMAQKLENAERIIELQRKPAPPIVKKKKVNGPKPKQWKIVVNEKNADSVKND